MMILEALYFFLPAYMANVVPPLFKKLPFLGMPLDFNKSFRGKRLLGDHKTVRGLIAACLFGFLTIYLQRYLYAVPFFNSISIIDYSQATLWLGFLLGLGAIFGDSVESFFKRMINIKPGKSWIIFDQIDFVLGAFLVSAIIFTPSIYIILINFLAAPILQAAFHYLGYVLGINKDKI